MDRILRILPAGVSITLLALAITGSRWAIQRPNRALGAEKIGRIAACATGENVPPRLLPAERTMDMLRPVGSLPPIVLAAGYPVEQRGEEADAGPGPELNGPSQLRTGPASDALSANDSPAEMPIADPCPLNAGPHAVEASAKPAPTHYPVPAENKTGDAVANCSPLPTARPAGERSEQLEQVARQADRQTRHGLELAGRNAHFAARSEFIAALRLIAEGLDVEYKTVTHVKALAAALCALREAEDFLPDTSRSEADLLPEVIATHATPVLKNPVERITPMSAMRCYHTFAQEQFAAAGGGEIAASMALHSLGKLHTVLARKKTAPIIAADSKAVVFFQAALLVYPKNYLAANDLGVLLAQNGNFAAARLMLEHSVAACPQADGWHNLSVVYRQLGQASLAQQAADQANRLRQSQLAQRRPDLSADGAVRWVEPSAFAQKTPNTPNWPAPTPAAAGRMSWGPAFQR